MRQITLPVESGTPDAVNALWKTAGAPETALPVYMSPGFDWIGMDPLVSAPNAFLGIKLDGEGPPVGLVPGHAILIPSTMTRFSVYNAITAVLGGTWFANGGSYGRVQLVAGVRDELLGWLASVRDRAAHPKAAVIAIKVATLAGQSAIFPTTNLRSGIRVSVVPLDAAGAVIDPAPADFACTLRPWHGPLAASAGLDAFGLGMNGDILGRPTGAYSGSNVQQSAADIGFAATDRARDLPVIVPALVAGMELVSFAGVGVSKVGIIVEGR